MAATRTFTFLGTGTSVGVPMLGCDCAVCRSDDPRNKRTRCSVLLRLPLGNLLIDTSPEMRLQLVRERVGVVHAIVFTHHHADHLFGLDDIRPFPRLLNGPMPIYCSDEVEEKIRQAFSYAFGPEAERLSAAAIPKLVLRRITSEPFTALGERIVPVPLLHGRFNVFGFRIDDVAYCTDVNLIPDSSWPLLEGVRVLVVDALRPQPHFAHFGLEEALVVIERLRPEKAYLTHLSHELEHEATSRRLPAGVEVAYDGLSFDF